MKRARGKKSYNHDELDVPEMLKNKRTAPTTSKKTSKKRNTKKQKRQNRVKIFLLIILALLVAFFVVMGFGWGIGGKDEGALIPVDMEKGKLNVLVLGVDKSGLRTDSMMLVSYDLKEASANIMSIPRDTQIKVKDRRVTRKINEVHAMHDSENNMLGPMGSIKAVTALTSVPIHYYIEFDFDAIDEITDVLGPIIYDVPDIEGNGKGMNYDDPAQDLHIHLKPGLQKLKGNQVQQFLRYRKSNSGNGDGSDTSRVERQQEFIKAMIDQKVNLSLIAKLPTIFLKMKENIETNFTAGDVLKYAKYLNGLTSEKIETFSLPGESKRTSAGWYYVCDFEETKKLITNSFGYNAKNLTNEIYIDKNGTIDKNNTVEKEEKVETVTEEKAPEVSKKPAPEPEPEPVQKEESKPTNDSKQEEPKVDITQDDNKESEDDEYISLD